MKIDGAFIQIDHRTLGTDGLREAAKELAEKSPEQAQFLKEIADSVEQFRTATEGADLVMDEEESKEKLGAKKLYEGIVDVVNECAMAYDLMGATVVGVLNLVRHDLNNTILDSDSEEEDEDEDDG